MNYSWDNRGSNLNIFSFADHMDLNFYSKNPFEMSWCEKSEGLCENNFLPFTESSQYYDYKGQSSTYHPATTIDTPALNGRKVNFMFSEVTKDEKITEKLNQTNYCLNEQPSQTPVICKQNPIEIKEMGCIEFNEDHQKFENQCSKLSTVDKIDTCIELMVPSGSVRPVPNTIGRRFKS